MKFLELFCGTKCMSKAFEAAGWETYTVDWDKRFQPTLCADIGTLTKEDLIELCGGVPDVVWLSPDCTTYSIAGIRYHRKKVGKKLIPTSEYAEFCDKVNAHIINVVKELGCLFFIENPRSTFRNMDFVQGIDRHTVTYCQYGDTRMKPTDIFTNHPEPQFKPPCNNGDKCHQAAPRGSQNGTQSLKTKRERAMIPAELCRYVVEISQQQVKDDGAN